MVQDRAQVPTIPILLLVFFVKVLEVCVVNERLFRGIVVRDCVFFIPSSHMVFQIFQHEAITIVVRKVRVVCITRVYGIHISIVIQRTNLFPKRDSTYTDIVIIVIAPRIATRRPHVFREVLIFGSRSFTVRLAVPIWLLAERAVWGEIVVANGGSSTGVQVHGGFVSTSPYKKALIPTGAHGVFTRTQRLAVVVTPVIPIRETDFTAGIAVATKRPTTIIKRTSGGKV